MKLILLVAFAVLFGLAIVELAPLAAADSVCIAGIQVYEGSNAHVSIGDHNILC